jgi:hypothetical protein
VEKGPEILAAWKEAAGSADADSTNMPCLSDDQLADFYSKTLELG